MNLCQFVLWFCYFFVRELLWRSLYVHDHIVHYMRHVSVKCLSFFFINFFSSDFQNYRTWCLCRILQTKCGIDCHCGAELLQQCCTVCFYSGECGLVCRDLLLWFITGQYTRSHDLPSHQRRDSCHCCRNLSASAVRVHICFGESSCLNFKHL